jgi:hypothetical protein
VQCTANGQMPHNDAVPARSYGSAHFPRRKQRRARQRALFRQLARQLLKGD